MKNNRPIRALQNNFNPHITYTHKLLDLSHFQIFDSTIYIFLCKEEQTLKWEKWAPRALKGILVGYDGYTIYRIYLKDQRKVIWIKNFQIFQDYKNKFSTKLPDYSKDTLTFQGFLLADNDNKQLEANLYSTHIGQKVVDVEAN